MINEPTAPIAKIDPIKNVVPKSLKINASNTTDKFVETKIRIALLFEQPISIKR